MKAVAIITTRIDYDDYYYLIVPDIAAGRKDAYTTYRIPTSGGVCKSDGSDSRVKIIGRELTLANSKNLVRGYGQR